MQMNGTMRNCRPKNVGPLLQRVIYGHAEDWNILFKRVQNSTASNLRKQKPKNAEARRIQWTTEKNLNRWFGNWEEDLVELGFGTRDETGAVYIPPEQLARIGNFDETCLNLDGSNTQRGGCPDVVM
jgi:hypothetical protein